jgi:hypothetical protein
MKRNLKRASLRLKTGAVVVLEAQKYATRKWTVPEIEIAIEYYKKEIKKLEEEKGELL